MKKLFVALLIASFVAITMPAFAVNPSGPGYNGDIMGMQSRYVFDPHRTFRLVRNGGGSLTLTSQVAITAGAIVVWDTIRSPIAADGVSITTTSTSGDSRVAGMAITTIPTPDSLAGSPRGNMGNTTASMDAGWNNWGWLQTYGKSAVTATAVTAIAGYAGDIPVGAAVGASTVPGSVSGFLSSAGTAGTTCGKAGFALEAITGGSTGYIFLKCE